LLGALFCLIDSIVLPSDAARLSLFRSLGRRPIIKLMRVRTDGDVSRVLGNNALPPEMDGDSLSTGLKAGLFGVVLCREGLLNALCCCLLLL
jgi:hypothetical protein